MSAKFFLVKILQTNLESILTVDKTSSFIFTEKFCTNFCLKEVKRRSLLAFIMFYE